MSTPAQYRFHVYFVLNPKRDLEFKMTVTVGLKDIMFFVNNTEKPICLHCICLLFKNFASIDPSNERDNGRL